MEISVLVALVLFVAFFVLRARGVEKRHHQRALTDAWRVVLDDPRYEQRKRYEEKTQREQSYIRAGA